MQVNGISTIVKFFKNILTLDTRLDIMQKQIEELKEDIKHLNNRIDNVFEILIEIRQNTNNQDRK